MRRRHLIIAAVVAIGLAGCSDKNSNENFLAPLTSVAGVYNLTTINGQAIPYTYPNGDVLSSSVATLNDDGSCTNAVTYSNHAGGTDTCTYTYSDGTITFHYTSGIDYDGAADGRVIEATFDGWTGVWVRQQ